MSLIFKSLAVYSPPSLVGSYAITGSRYQPRFTTDAFLSPTRAPIRGEDTLGNSPRPSSEDDGSPFSSPRRSGPPQSPGAYSLRSSLSERPESEEDYLELLDRANALVRAKTSHYEIQIAKLERDIRDLTFSERNLKSQNSRLEGDIRFERENTLRLGQQASRLYHETASQNVQLERKVASLELQLERQAFEFEKELGALKSKKTLEPGQQAIDKKLLASKIEAEKAYKQENAELRREVETLRQQCDQLERYIKKLEHKLDSRTRYEEPNFK